jgi:RHS repeat-associated protein
MEYDIDNRLVSWSENGQLEQYQYLADNKRVWKKAPNGVETVYFYGVGGQKLVTYRVASNGFWLVDPVRNVYFGGKVIRADGEAVVQDRLGSVVARGSEKKDYFPYGEEIGVATAGNRDKYGTYHRDQTTGLDYADQRYYKGLQGRFLTSDPYEASGGAAEPGSWGRYAYVGGDPVNYRYPKGLESQGPGDYIYCPETGTWMPDYVCDMLRKQSDPTNQHSTCSDGTKVPQGQTCPANDGGSFTGRQRAHEGLRELTAGRLLGKKDCADLLEKLAEQVGGGATAASIAGAVERQARETYNSWTMYDGPSASTVFLEPAKFGYSASGKVKTVADWFNADKGRQGLSQQNGSAIFIRSSDWGSFYNSYTTFDGDLSAYGFGTLLHEVLHKQSVGGFTHGQMEAALAAVGFTSADNPLYKNINSSGFGVKCF